MISKNGVRDAADRRSSQSENPRVGSRARTVADGKTNRPRASHLDCANDLIPRAVVSRVAVIDVNGSRGSGIQSELGIVSTAGDR